MAVSGTSTFNPSNGEILLWAFSLCGIRRTELTQQHLADARLIPDPDAVVRRFGAEFEKLLYLAMMGPWDAPLDAAAAEALLQDATVA